MEFENFPIAKELIEEVDKKLELINDLHGTVQVVCMNQNGVKLITIPLGDDGNHDFTPLAQALIGQAVELTQAQIQTLKEKLKPL